MSSNTKERLLQDLEALRHQLAEIEAYGADGKGEAPASASIPTLETDNIPLLGDAVPADRDEAIAAHHAAMAKLDAELKELDKQEALENNEEQAKAESASTPPASEHDHAAMQATLELQAEALASVAASISTPDMTSQTFESVIPPMTAQSLTSDDNPFLPAHLRERLNKSKSSLLEEIARSSESLDASTALLRNFGSAKQATSSVPQNTEARYQDIVDTLVAKYLPLIEADLRQRLTTTLQQQAEQAQKRALEPSH